MTAPSLILLALAPWFLGPVHGPAQREAAYRSSPRPLAASLRCPARGVPVGLVLGSAPRIGPNLLLNPGFDQGARSWTHEEAGRAKAALEWIGVSSAPSGLAGQVARFKVTAVSDQNWHAQFYQNGVDLQDGEPYTLSFWARADADRSLTVQALVDQDDYHLIGLNQKVQLGPKWRKFFMPFVATRVVPNHTRVSFILGDALGTVDLAGAALRHTPPGATAPHPLIGSWETRGRSAAKTYRFTFNADGTGSVRTGPVATAADSGPQAPATNPFRWHLKEAKKELVIATTSYTWSIEGADEDEKLTLKRKGGDPLVFYRVQTGP